MQRSLQSHRQALLEEDESVEEEWSLRRDWQGVSHRRIVSSQKTEFHESFQTHASRTEINPRTELGLLKTGDHIGWHRPYVIWHHAIVSNVDARSRMLKIIHYHKEDGVKNQKTKIKEQWIDAEKESGDLFRFDYTSDIIDENPATLVLQRARSKVGEGGYKFLKNNCEHFATFCKTGIKDSAQVHWAWGKAKETFHTCGCVIGKEVGKLTVKSIAQSTGKVAAAEAVELAGHASNIVGAGLVAGFEAVHCAYDIYHMHQKKKEGKISQRDFKVSATQRVSEGVIGGAFAIGGSIFGGFLGSFIPVVGTFIGSVVGGAIGSVVGKAIGSIFGRWFGNLLW